MYIAQAYNYLHDWWRYVLGIIITFFGMIFFSLPHFIAVALKTSGDATVTPTDLNDIEYLNSLFDLNLNFLFVLLPFLGGLITLFLVVKFLHNLPILALTTSRKKIDWTRFWFIFILWGAFAVISIVADYFFYPEDYVLNFKWDKFLLLALIAILLIPIQTSFEEYLFRGYLMQGFGVLLKNKWAPLCITSIVFGLLHIANPEVDKLGQIIMVYYIGTGLFLGVLTLMDEGMELALGFHAANNLIGALLVSADWTAFHTYSVLRDISDPTSSVLFDIFLPVVVIYPILLLILAKRYKWTNWKDKLFGSVMAPSKAKPELLND